MRFLGVDYGTKRIGLAISDENGTLAFPKEIIPNDEKATGDILETIRKENISEVIVGESLDFNGTPNKIWGKAEIFIEDLGKKLNIPIRKQKEFLTTVEARRFSKEGESVDASAAALILQRYLDQFNKNK